MTIYWFSNTLKRRNWKTYARLEVTACLTSCIIVYYRRTWIEVLSSKRRKPSLLLSNPFFLNQMYAQGSRIYLVLGFVYVWKMRKFLWGSTCVVDSMKMATQASRLCYKNQTEYLAETFNTKRRHRKMFFCAKEHQIMRKKKQTSDSCCGYNNKSTDFPICVSVCTYYAFTIVNSDLAWKKRVFK